MKIDVLFDTLGAAPAGIDREAVIANIQAEVDKLTEAAKSAPASKKMVAPPEGAQGDLSGVQWLIDIATDPEMAKIYAKGLIFALNAILASSYIGKSSDTKAEGEKDSAKPVKVTVKDKNLVKEIILPAATAVIKEFLDSLGID